MAHTSRGGVAVRAMARTTRDTRLTCLLITLCVVFFALGLPATTWAQAPGATASGAPAGQQESVSQQVATAVSQASQEAPVNIHIPVSVLSPGDHGPVTQANVVTAGAEATNVAQSAGAPVTTGTPGATATTGQEAAAVSHATQSAPVNIYIPVSILSPGDHGPVTQVNSVNAQAVATNVAGAVAAPDRPSSAGPGQAAAASGTAAQQAPQNVSAPVTIGGVSVGEHSPSQPWSWSWSWELDCSAGAPPPIAALGPIIKQVTGGAWEWNWTWTCAQPDPAAPGAPSAGTEATSAPVATHEGPPERAVALTRDATAGPGAGSAPANDRSGPGPERAHPAARTRHVATPRAAAVLASLSGAAAMVASVSAEPAPRAGGSPAPTRPSGSHPPLRAPVDPGAPTLFSAGASGGSGPAPLSVGLAALIGAFGLLVPRLGTRTRTPLVHRSPQAAPHPKDRPG